VSGQRDRRGIKTRMLTILLVVGMEVIHDLTHAWEREVVGIESENLSLVHVVWG
jgi:hypothetical protein